MIRTSDFAIDTAPSACASVRDRVVNELFRRHVFQVGITFHGGMEAIAYEWGADLQPSAEVP